MLATLADLIEPLSESAFVEILRARRPLLQRTAGTRRYAELIDWDGFMHCVTSGSFPARKLRITRQGAELPPVFYRDGDQPKPDVIERVMASGGSIIAYGIEPHVPNFTQLCRAVAERLGERIEGGVIATTGAGGALTLHYDDADLVVLQIEGSKRWIVQREPVADPVPGMPHPPGGAEADPLLDVTLGPGDFLFVPAGYWHRCENQAGRSLHAGIFFWPLTAPRAVDLLFRQIIKDATDRRPLRFDPGDASEVEAALRRVLIEKVESLSLVDLLARHRRSDPMPGKLVADD